MHIEIVGDKDKTFEILYNNLRKAIIALKIIAPIHVTPEINRTAEHSHIAVPALYINKTLHCAGKTPSAGEITSWLTTS
jgi:hypothetical protein